MANPSKNRSKTVGKNADGTFAPGNRLGKGRPTGSRNSASLALEAMLEGEAEEIGRKAIELAKGGDMQAIKLVIERLCPAPKSRRISLDLPDATDAAGIASAQASVVQAVAGGQICPDEGAALSGMLEARRKAIETQEHEARIKRLEDAQNA
ncbi:MAG: hypothetical protein RIM33_02745 [Alphaproteobacteria bacterium]